MMSQKPHLNNPPLFVQLVLKRNSGKFFPDAENGIIHRRVYLTRAEAKADFFEYLEAFYKRRRRHSTLGYLSPVEFEQRAP